MLTAETYKYMEGKSICYNCRHWARIEAPKGKMPSAGKEHRKCQRPRIDVGVTEWRHPTDSCTTFTPQENAHANRV